MQNNKAIKLLFWVVRYWDPISLASKVCCCEIRILGLNPINTK